MLKLGFDIHGVIDEQIPFFVELTQLLVGAGHEVHIISGPKKEKILVELVNLGVSFTHVFSITDYHLSMGMQVEFDDQDNPHMPDYLWDKTKAEYCLKHGIQLHLDDSDVYNYFFKTPYARYYSKTKRKHYINPRALEKGSKEQE